MYYVIFKDDYGKPHVKEFACLADARKYALPIPESRSPRIAKEVS